MTIQRPKNNIVVDKIKRNHDEVSKFQNVAMFKVGDQ
jgi:hypothetical protein